MLIEIFTQVKVLVEIFTQVKVRIINIYSSKILIEISTQVKVLKEIFTLVPKNIKQQKFPTLAINQYIRMISEGSHESENWSNS